MHEKFTAQLNDTHPAIAIAELMRLLIDENAMDWEASWAITRRTFAYTNHTLLPEALERWPLALFGRILPRHMEIIFEINARFLDEVRIRFFGDDHRVSSMSLIDESGERYVRMAHLACVGSHAINGVAALHSELLKTDVLKDFYAMWPEKFSNKTNGVTPRRWIALSNPGLSALVTEVIGDDWVRDLTQPAPAGSLRPGHRLRGALAEDQTRQQGRARQGHPQPHRRLGGSELDVRRAGEAHPRVQAPAPEHPARDRAVSPATLGCGLRHAAAHLHLRRQGRTGLLHREAHHQAHHLGGRDHQQGSGREGPHQGGLLAELQRQDRPAHLSRRGPVRTDLHRRQGSLRHRQHEVLHERRADHRHAGRCEHRDLPGGGPRELLHVRTVGTGGLCAEGAGLPPGAVLRFESRAAPGHRPGQGRLLFTR